MLPLLSIPLSFIPLSYLQIAAKQAELVRTTLRLCSQWDSLSAIGAAPEGARPDQQEELDGILPHISANYYFSREQSGTVTREPRYTYL